MSSNGHTRGVILRAKKRTVEGSAGTVKLKSGTKMRAAGSSAKKGVSTSPTKIGGTTLRHMSAQSNLHNKAFKTNEAKRKTPAVVNKSREIAHLAQGSRNKVAGMRRAAAKSMTHKDAGNLGSAMTGKRGGKFVMHNGVKHYLKSLKK